MDQLKRKLNCLIVEKQKETAATISTFIQSSAPLELVLNSSDSDMVSSLLTTIRVDLIFVNVDEISPDQLRRFKEASPSTLFILLSSDPQYQVLPDDLNTFDCLIKPLTLSRLQLALKRILQHFVYQQEIKSQELSKKQAGPVVRIRSGGNEHQIPVTDILYVESDGEYVKYHTRKGRFMALGSLKKLAEVLGDEFVQIHRSYVINRAFVTSKSRQHIELTGQRMIPIGKTYKNAFRFTSPSVVF